ncbi:hypothetical protein BCF50_1807 [Chryseobacterium daecheongense]|uniref:Uncharacterized protein n=1 Tax=Chryseobacterium daecheongense TaxID=192389 RepID=A0ABY2FV61_9FLAO|nr:hypothetical protein BCF50_1807 [Chryseobacterium daecheongense]
MNGNGGQGGLGFFNGANDFQSDIDKGFNQAGPYKFILWAHEPK